jgi:thioester reductase-like protein
MSGRPVPLHYVSTLSAVQAEALARPNPLPETGSPSAEAPPERGYSRSKWVAERYLARARRQGAVVTVLRLGEVLPGQDRVHPNPRALTHLLLSAIHQLGLAPDAAIRSDYTPVDYASARVVAAVLDRGVWGTVLHVFHPGGVDFAGALATAGEPVTRVSCARFLTALREAAQRETGQLKTAQLTTAQRTGGRDLAALAALLPAPSDHGEAGLRRELAALLTDNAALYRKDECQRLEQRWQLTDPDLRGAIAAYRDHLAATAPPGPGRGPALAALAGGPAAPQQTGR